MIAGYSYTSEAERYNWEITDLDWLRHRNRIRQQEQSHKKAYRQKEMRTQTELMQLRVHGLIVDPVCAIKP